MKRDYEINEIKETTIFFVYFVHFVYFVISGHNVMDFYLGKDANVFYHHPNV